MSHPSASDLQGWRDPDELLDALYELGSSGEPDPDTRDAVAALADHEDTDVRQEALRLLLVAWKLDAYRENAVQALRFEPEEEVRTTAAFGLAAVSTENTRREDVSLLLELLLDDEQPIPVRGAAYEALLILYRRPLFPPMTRDFMPAEDVDWKWVNQLQTEIGLSH